MPRTRVSTANTTPARRPAKGRPVRSAAPAGALARPLGGRGQGLVSLFRDLKSEIKKVSWPTPRQTANMTAVIVALSAALGVFLGAVDYGFQELFRLLLQGLGVAGY